MQRVFNTRRSVQQQFHRPPASCNIIHMASSLTEALLRRSSQWQAFHEWERNRADAVLPICERVAWYVAAFNFVTNLPRNVAAEDKSEKIKQVRTLQARLRHSKQSDRNA